MIRATILAVILLVVVDQASAQDVQGIELCTRETRMDRRTGCLQSNIEYLQKLIVGNAAEAQRKLNAAASEISALKGAIANLQATVEKLQATVDKLQASKPDAAAKPNSK
jgi:peptidoglycan hydrolase CwlO-like protein